MYICPKCGFQSADPVSYCSNCGSKLIIDEQPIKADSSKQIKILVFGIIIAVIVLSVGKYCFDSYSGIRYRAKVETSTYYMLEGAAEAEDACNLICNVWHHTIWEVKDSDTDKYTLTSSGSFYDDFNDSLDNLFRDEDFVEKLQGISDNLDEANANMIELQNPPKGCEQLHDAYMDFYDEYYNLVNLAINPEGNYDSYSSAFSDADSNSIKFYDKLKIYFEH